MYKIAGIIYTGISKAKCRTFKAHNLVYSNAKNQQNYTDTTLRMPS